MAGGKIAIFDEVTSATYPSVRNLLKDDFVVYFSKIDKKVALKPELKPYFVAKKVISLSDIDFDCNNVMVSSMYFAHKNIDVFFERHYAKNQSITDMQRFLKFTDIIDMYKKIVLERLGEAYLLELMVNDINERKNPEVIHFYFLNNPEVHKDKLSLLDRKVKPIDSNNFVTNARLFIKKAAYLGYSMYMIFKKFKSISNKKKPREFRVGISIKHPRNIFLMNYYTESVLIDEGDLPKEDVLFIDESKNVNIEDYKKRGYNYTRLLDDKESFSPDLIKNLLRNFFPVWLKSIFALFNDWPIVYANSKIMADYVIWNIFSENFRIKNYAKWLLPDYPSKTHVLSGFGVKTWFIFPDNYAIDYHTGWNEKIRSIILFSFMHYDYAVVFGNKIKRYLQAHRNCINHYITNGSLFSQIDSELMHGKLKSPMSDALKNKKLNNLKLIGVFDSTFGNAASFKMHDGIVFANDMLKILDECPNLGVIFKAKKELGLTPGLLPVYNILRDHPRCLFLARYDGSGISAPEVISKSDLVITVPFTTTTIEALGAKKRAFYYDVNGHHVGDKYYFNKFPNFVAHDYAELKKLIDWWLNEVSNAEFEAFLEKYIKDEIDPYLDGKALTRLRRLLAQ